MRIFIQALLLAVAIAISNLTAQAIAPPIVVKAESAPEWDAKFAGKEGWIGGDGVYSVVLGPKRVLWLFGDTILGTVKGERRANAVMVNNTLGLQSVLDKDALLRFINGKTKEGKPAAFFVPDDGKGWFWPQGVVLANGKLFVFLPQIDKTKDPGVLGFKQIGETLAVVENPDDEPEKWRVKQHAVPLIEHGQKHERSWGSAVLANGPYLYVYGYEEERGKGIGKRRLAVARAPADKLDDFTTWRFRTQEGWSEKSADAVPLADGMATEFSVSRIAGDRFALVYTENGLGTRILGRFADAPDGPWSAPVLLFQCPEMATDKGVFSYAAKAHPWAVQKNELLISYCVNTWDFGRLFKDELVYRPKFVHVDLKFAK